MVIREQAPQATTQDREVDLAPRDAGYRHIIVNKPWGYEYLIYENEHVGAWLLHIRAGAQTSLHCHPNKKTGLVLLSGSAKVSFLNGSTELTAVDKLILRAGLFHSTQATSPEGLFLIEIETPRDKGNLVRLDDEYGRKATPYEGKDATRPKTADCVWLEAPIGGTAEIELAGVRGHLEVVTTAKDLLSRSEHELIAVLDGGMCSPEGDAILAPGDIVDARTVRRLARDFVLPKPMFFLSLPTQAGAHKKKVPARSVTLGAIANVSRTLERERTLELFSKTCRNRFFELQVAKAHDAKRIQMPVYLSLGQEHIPAAVASACPDFCVFAQHRAHSYYLSFGGDPDKLVDELLHRETGCAGGMGGSASIHSPEIGMYGHSGLMGDQIPIAVGAALGSGKRTLAVMGDASAEEDYVYGAMAFAATKRAPVLFLCEDNDLSILTHVATRRSWSMVDLAKALGILAHDITDDPWLITHHVRAALSDLPAFLNIRTCRERWHAGTGNDGPPEWNRFALMQAEMTELGLADEAAKVEADAKAWAEALWQRLL